VGIFAWGGLVTNEEQSIMARFVAIAVLLAIAAGVYAFMQTSNLTAVQMTLAARDQELADLKKRVSTSNMESKNTATALAACKDEVTALQTAAEAAKKPAGRR
jgi:uncharacterized protein HemX